MQSELADAKHELLKIQEMLEMAEKVIYSDSSEDNCLSLKQFVRKYHVCATIMCYFVTLIDFYHLCSEGGIRPLSGTSSFSNDTVRLTAASTHACYNGDFGI